MGSGFFKNNAGAAPKIGATNTNLEARAIGAPAYAGRAAGTGAAKDIAAASAINKAVSGLALKKASGSAAYPKGPKI